MKTNWIMAALFATSICFVGGGVSSVKAQVGVPTLASAYSGGEVALEETLDSALDYGVGCDDKSGYSVCCDKRLLGIVRRTDRCFGDFISPMTNPVFFEDPRNLSEVRFIFLHNEVPGVLGGGDVQVFAPQVRVSLTERLSLIAAKDGYIFGNHPRVDDGWTDVAVGLKYTLFSDPCARNVF